jgi:hypothetical protein
MSHDPKANDLIERYLLGKLSDTEIKGFNQRLGMDREFARKFRLIRDFPEMMSVQGQKEFQQKLAERTEHEGEIKKFRLPKPSRLIWTTIAVVSIVIAILFLFFILRKSHSDVPVLNNGNQVKNKTNKVPVKQETEKAKEIPSIIKPVETKQNDIELVNPAEGVILGRNAEVLFSWKQETDTFTRLYVFSDFNDKLILWRGINPGIREYRISGKNFFPGRYYWYIGTNKIRRTFTITP